MVERVLRKKLVREALKVVGAPYKRGAYLQGSSKRSEGFDCSSLNQYLFRKIGITIPRSSLLQASQGKEVSSRALHPGDLVFFESTRGHYWYSLFNQRKIYIGHVALYLGNGEVLDASEDRGGKVMKRKLKELTRQPHYRMVLMKRIIGWKSPVHIIPPYSQLIDVKEKGWQNKSCGIVSLKMVMDFWSKKHGGSRGIDSLIRTYGKKTHLPSGWSHPGLAMIARRAGFESKSFDLSYYQNQDAFPILESELGRGPVVVSIYKDFNAKNGGHLIAVTGVRKNVVYFNEPNSKTRAQIRRRVGLQKFLAGWKRRFITVHPRRI